MLPRFRVTIVLLAGCLAMTAACGPGVDLSEDLEVTEVLTGFYDNGPKQGGSHVVPSISFRLKNNSDANLSGVQLTVQYWVDGQDGELDSKLLRGIGAEALAPGEQTEPLLARAEVGYTQQGPLNEVFEHRLFKDVIIRMFARRSGAIVKIGEWPVERRLIPHFDSSSPR